MCQEEFRLMEEALAAYGPDSSEFIAARGRFLRCYGELMKARDSHSAGWDERLYLLQKQILESWERLVGRLKVPPRPTCGARSMEARSKIFADRKNAMAFSERLDEAFRKTGVVLNDDETYACLVCIVKKPRYVSEALALDPLGQSVEGAPRVNYIFEPAIMEPVMNAIDQDAIKYVPTPKQKNK